MSYFDDVFEPRLYREPYFARNRNDQHWLYVEDCANRGIWPTSHGEVEISSMETSYIYNCLGLMCRKNKKAMLAIFEPVFEKELAKRTAQMK